MWDLLGLDQSGASGTHPARRCCASARAQRPWLAGPHVYTDENETREAGYGRLQDVICFVNRLFAEGANDEYNATFWNDPPAHQDSTEGRRARDQTSKRAKKLKIKKRHGHGTEWFHSQAILAYDMYDVYNKVSYLAPFAAFLASHQYERKITRRHPCAHPACDPRSKTYGPRMCVAQIQNQALHWTPSTSILSPFL